MGINEDGFLELSDIHGQGSEVELSADRFTILQGLSPLNMRILSQTSRVMHVAKGVQLVLAGDTPHDLCFVAKGAVLITKTFQGKPKPVARLQAGDVYGEYGVLRGKTRFASVYTAEASEIIRVDLQAVQQVLDADEQFKTRMVALMHQRILHSFLSTHVVFQGLDDAARKRLSSQLAVTSVARDEVLFEQGKSAEAYYLVLSGEAEVLVDSDGAQMLLEIRRDDSVLGEVRSGKQYAYTARASNDLDLLMLDKQAIALIQAESAAAMKQLTAFINQQAKKTVAAIQQLHAS